MPDVLQLIRDDHKKVQDIFKRFESSEDKDEKKQLVQTAIQELEMHAKLEEELFYPEVRRRSTDIEEKMNEADEEHHVAELLMEELKRLRGNAKTMDAKFMVLAENVKHHIQEEESEILPKAAELGRDFMSQLGEQWQERKMALQQNGMSSRGGSRGRSAGTRGTRTSTRSSGTTRRRSTGAAGRTAAASRGGKTTARRTRAASTSSGNGRKTRSTSTRSTSRAKSGGGTRSRSESSGRGRTTTRSTTSRGSTTRRTTRGTASRSGRRTTTRSAGSRGGATRSRGTTRR